MKKTLIYFTLFIILSGAFISCVQQNRDANIEDDIAAVNEFYNQYLQYAETGDLDNFITLFDDNALRSEPGIPAIVGKENIKERFKFIFSQANSKIHLHGDAKIELCGDLAYGYREGTLVSTPKDGSSAMKTDIKVLTIFKRQNDGSWKLYIDNINFHPTWSQDSIPSELLDEENPYY